MTSIFTQIEGWVTTTEQDVITVIADIRNDITVAESAISSALSWVAGEVPDIVQALQVAVGFATSVGVVTAPELAAAQAAVVALQAFASSSQSGDGSFQSNTQAVVQGYNAYVQAQAATAMAKATASAVVATPAAGSPNTPPVSQS